MLPIIFAIAIDTDRLTIGLGKELATQDTIIWSWWYVSYQMPRGDMIETKIITGRDCADWHQEHSKEACARVRCRCSNGITNHGYQHQADDVDRAIARSCGRPCHKNGDKEGRKLSDILLAEVQCTSRDRVPTHPDRSRQPKSIDGPKPERAHNRRKKILKSLAQQTKMLKQCEQI